MDTNKQRENLLKYANLKRSRGGVITADRYFRGVQDCYTDGDSCPVKLFNIYNEAEWRIKLDEAETKLVYSNDDMEVKEFEKAKGGPLMVFDAVITSTKRDRDQDILEAKGATIDPKSPLLWQHIPMSPIGAFMGKTSHTDDLLAGRFSIADTELGRDTALLIEMKALRISHGFDPTKFKPLKEEGWHIEEFEIFEVSVVSIPSNTDAVITQFSREKLHSPLVKQWAKKMFDERTTQVAVGAELDIAKSARGDVKAESIGEDYHIEYYETCDCQKDDDFEQLKSTMRSRYLTAAAAELDEQIVNGNTKGIPAGCYLLPKSFEWIRESLSMDLKEVMGSIRGWPWVFATYKDHAIVAVEYNNGNVELFKADWGMAKGKPVWKSELVEVDVQVDVSVIEKSRDMHKALGLEPESKEPDFTDAVAFVMACGEPSQLKHIRTIVAANLEHREHEQYVAEMTAENEQLVELFSN